MYYDPFSSLLLGRPSPSQLVLGRYLPRLRLIILVIFPTKTLAKR